MAADDPARENARERFLWAVQSGYSTERGERFAVPHYHDGKLVGQLSAYRFTPSRARGTIVFFGGFDSYIEEMTSAFLYLRCYWPDAEITTC